MYLIEEQDFQRQYYIAGSQGRTQDGSSSLLTQFIDGFVPQFLKDALGITLFNELDSNITDGELDENAPQKWKDLVNGKIYIVNDIEKEWKGLVYNMGAFKESILIPYVYYHWLENELSTMTATGDKVISSKNAVNVNPNQRLVKCWNDFVTMNQHCSDYNYYPSISIVNGVKFTDWLSNSTSTYVSLIEFLQDNETDYPDANLKVYNYKNQFGL